MLILTVSMLKIMHAENIHMELNLTAGESKRVLAIFILPTFTPVAITCIVDNLLNSYITKLSTICK